MNGAITPATDLMQWGTKSAGTSPKRASAIARITCCSSSAGSCRPGLPRQALLVTVVTDLAGDGHAVLTVHTDRGDYILDNMNNDVKLWRETPYGFVKRQSRFVSNEWVSLNGGGAAPVDRVALERQGLTLALIGS